MEIIKKTYFSKKTQLVFISSSSEEKCDNIAKAYFKSRNYKIDKK